MKKSSFLKVVIGLTCFSLIPNLLVALPLSPEIVSGNASVSQVDANTMVVEAADQAIINYQSFNVAHGERVQFIQPTSSSVVLNRVTGDNGSEILGQLQSNGKVFLVNPNGVYFGRESQVNVGSLIASSLDISNADFLNQRFEFFVKAGTEASQVVNQGTLSASAEGSIALISGNVRNEGVIIANTGKVVLAAGEKVTLDFVGNGLMQFAVEGKLKDAMIEQTGSIQALEGQVHLAMSSVGKIIQEVINTEGIVVGTTLVEENGVIRLTSKSNIRSSVIEIAAREGSTVQVSGALDVSNSEGQGGTIHVFGENLNVMAAQMDASGSVGGGEVLMGGDAYGSGLYYKATNTVISQDSTIKADAISSGSGGKVVAWANNFTHFDGVISARGGSLEGHGGFVETSGKIGLASATGYVDTTAAFGRTGKWILDPATITISSSGTDSLLAGQDAGDLASKLVIHPSVFNNVSSDVFLTALGGESSITIAPNTTLTMAPGYGIQFNVDMESGQIVLQDNSVIETTGGFVVFNGPTVISSNSAVIRTDLNGSSAPITFTSTVNGESSSASNIMLSAGARGIITLTEGAGEISPMGMVTIDARNLELGASIYTKGQDITISSAVLLTNDANFDTTLGGSYQGGNISFLGTKSTIDGPYKVGFDSGSGMMVFAGAVGNYQPVSSFKPKGAGVLLSANITADGNTTIFESAVTIGTSVTITDLGTSGVFFQSTVNGTTAGVETLTVSAPIGMVSFGGAVGGTTAPGGLTVSSNEIIQASTVAVQGLDNTTATLSYTAPTSILINGNITISDAAVVTDGTQGVVAINNPAVFTPNVTIDVSSKALVSFGSITLNGASIGSGNLTLVTRDSALLAGGAGTVALQSAAHNLANLSVTTHIFTQAAAASITAPSGVTIDVDAVGSGSSFITTAGSAISTIAGNIALTGGATFTLASDLTTVTGDITITPTNTTAVTYTGTILTETGAVTVAANVGGGANSLSLGGATVMSLGDGSASLQQIAGANTLAISGTGGSSLTLGAAVTAVTGLTATVGSITQTSTVATAGAVSYTAPLGIAINGASITATAGAVNLYGPVTLGNATFGITTSAGNGNIGFNGTTSTINGASAVTLTAGTGVVTLDAPIGGTTAILSLSVASATQVNLKSNVTASAAGGIVFTPNVMLTGPVNLLATDSSGDVTFTGTVNGFYPLNIVSGTGATGIVTLTGAIGATVPLASLSVTGGSAAGSILTNTSVKVVDGPMYFQSGVTLQSATTFTGNGTGVYFLSTVAGGGFDFDISTPTGTAFLGGAVTGVGVGAGTVTIAGLNVEQAAAVTATAAANVTYTGTQSTILAADTTVSGAGNITVTNSATIGNPVTLTAATGTVTLNGVDEGSDVLTITSAAGTVAFATAPISPSSLLVSGAATITQSAAAPISTIGLLSLATTLLAAESISAVADLRTAGGDIVITSLTNTLGSGAVSSNINTAGGNFTVTGATTYNGGTITTSNGNASFGALTLATANTGISLGSGAVSFGSTLAGGGTSVSIAGSAASLTTFTGAVTGVANLTVDTGKIVQTGAVTTTGSVLYIAPTSISMAAALTGATGITITGPVTLSGTAAVSTTNSNITFNTALSTVDGGIAFVVAAGTGTARFDGSVGGKTALTSFTSSGGGTSAIGSDINTTGVIAFTTSPVVLTGSSSMISSGSTVTFGGTVNGGQDLFVSGTAITFGSTVGATTALKSLTTSGTVSVGGNIRTRQ